MKYSFSYMVPDYHISFIQDIIFCEKELQFQRHKIWRIIRKSEIKW